MLKLGNDIVNISTERSKLKYLDQRFLKRVFTKNEQNLILAVNDKSKIFWAIWAAKEAAFKACQKQCPELIFSHNTFEVNFDINSLNCVMVTLDNYSDSITGTVYYKDKFLAVTWQFNEHTVHCMAILLDNNKIFTDWNKVNYNIFIVDSNNHKEESLQTRFYAKRFLIEYGFDQNVSIVRPSTIVDGVKRYKPPILLAYDQPLENIEISLSHDHGWGAVAFFSNHLCK